MALNRKLVGAAAFSLGLAGGGVAGALLGTPSLSGAQDDTTETTDTTVAGEPDGGRFFGPRGEALATAAEVLGMSEADLRAALADGQSIAEVAEAQGVDVQTVIDALVAEATERLEEIEASLPEHMTDLVNRTGWGEHRRGGPGHHGPGLEAAAEAIGISVEDLRTALADGATLAEVAEANGVDADTLIEALVAEATTRIDEAVANGRIDADRAEEIKADLVERITAHVNGEGPGPMAGGPGRHGGFGPGPLADDES